jgi:hypothetical protein
MTRSPIMTKLEESIRAAMGAVEEMTPEQRAEMWRKQRESFVRAMTTPCEHGVLDFEQCGECRA